MEKVYVGIDISKDSLDVAVHAPLFYLMPPSHWEGGQGFTQKDSP